MVNHVTAKTKPVKMPFGAIFNNDSTTVLGVLQALLGVHLVGHQRTVFGAVSCLLLTAAGILNILMVSFPPMSDSFSLVPQFCILCLFLISSCIMLIFMNRQMGTNHKTMRALSNYKTLKVPRAPGKSNYCSVIASADPL
jgi:hypothetical protein